MSKKLAIGSLAFFIGVLVVFMLIEVASAGYEFGRYLASPKAQETPASI